MRKRIKKLVQHPLFSGSAIMIIGLNSASAINYLYHFIIGRLLGPSSYGELASLISIMGLVGIIPGSLSLVIVKQVASAKNKLEADKLISWFKQKMFMLSIIFSLLVLLGSPFISSFLRISNTYYLILISVFFLFSLQAGFNRSILQGLLKFKEMVITILAENMVRLLLSVLLVLAGLAVGGAMLAFVLTALSGFYLTNYYLKIKNQKEAKIPTNNLRSTISLAIPILIQSLSITSLYSSDVILVKHFFSSYDAGIYASLSVLGKIIFFGAGPISAVMFPLISMRSSKGESYQKVFIFSLLATTFFALGISLFYFIAPNFAINILFGSAYLGYSGLLIWFAVFITLFTLSSLVVNFGISLGKNKIVIFPLVFAFLQILLISLFHQNLLTVIIISIIVTTLLLLTLLIYLIFERELIYEKSNSQQDKINLDNRPSL